MDGVRFGLGIRALRRRAGWTQAELGREARLSASAISRIERGRCDRLSVAALERVVAAMGARMRVDLLWQGEELARLLDRRHAAVVEHMVRLLQVEEWEVEVEVTFAERGERGSIDLLAWHPATRSLLVIEVKTVVPDVQAMLASIDRKFRLAPRVARGRGWPEPTTVSRLLAIPGDRTARRRVDRFAATFNTALPARNWAVRGWIARPAGPMSGILFVTDATDTATRHRVAHRRQAAALGTMGKS